MAQANVIRVNVCNTPNKAKRRYKGQTRERVDRQNGENTKQLTKYTEKTRSDVFREFQLYSAQQCILYSCRLAHKLFDRRHIYNGNQSYGHQYNDRSQHEAIKILSRFGLQRVQHAPTYTHMRTHTARETYSHGRAYVPKWGLAIRCTSVFASLYQLLTHLSHREPYFECRKV